MKFLKEALGDKYDEFILLINQYNRLEKNRRHQIKLANLAAGGYVSKAKYAALERKRDKLLIQIDSLNKKSIMSPCNNRDLLNVRRNESSYTIELFMPANN